MVTITLPPDLERVIAERAKQQGTTPELWALDKLNQSLQAEAAAESTLIRLRKAARCSTFLRVTSVFSTAVSSCQAAQMSQDTDRKFAEGMLNKRQKGKL